MGCGCSSASSSLGALRPCAGVRVIHTNGYVEDFLGPGVVTVAHVTGCYADSAGSSGGKGQAAGQPPSPPRYVLCSSAHLLQPGRGPFRPDDPLQPGTVYFLLPQSVFQAESSAVDLACLMNRLTALARKGGATAAPKTNPLDALLASAAAAPQADVGRYQHHHHHQQEQQQPVKKAIKEPGRAAPWRPRLERIDESFGRSSMRSASCRSACSEA